MRAELLNADKVKIFFENADIKQLDIKYSEMDYKNEKVKKLFWQAIHYAKAQTGFDPTGFKLLIEAFPAPDGGFMLYVTRLYKSRPEEEPAAPELPSERRYIFRFECMDDLLDSAACFSRGGVRITSGSAYRDSEGRCYLLVIPSLRTRSDKLCRLLRDLSEYGTRVEGPYAAARVTEHLHQIAASGQLKTVLFGESKRPH